MTGASIPLAWENKNKLKQESEKNWNILQNLIEEKNSIEDNKYKNESAASPRRLNVPTPKRLFWNEAFKCLPV